MPRSTAQGAKSRAISSGVLPMARSTPANASGVSSSTVCSWPRKVIVVPAERFDARNLIRSKGRFRSSSNLANDPAHGARGADDRNDLEHGNLLRHAKKLAPQERTCRRVARLATGLRPTGEDREWRLSASLAADSPSARDDASIRALRGQRKAAFGSQNP